MASTRPSGAAYAKAGGVSASVDVRSVGRAMPSRGLPANFLNAYAMNAQASLPTRASRHSGAALSGQQVNRGATKIRKNLKEMD